MDQTQSRRKREDVMEEEMIAEELVIQEVLEELIYITHPPTQQGNYMHIKIP
jgi:hypothetical protein